MYHDSSDLSKETHFWAQFFKEASIPPQFAQNYAEKFSQNRIRVEMLAELDRPLLNELGIAAIGDCLSILKHAKAMANNKAFEYFKEYESASSSMDSQQKGVKNGVAKRIIESCISKSPSFSDADGEKNSAKKLANNSTLSADLFSRLNFNPAPKSNSDDAKSGVMVTSTTNEDEDLESLKGNKQARKRKHNDDDSEKKQPVLEYRGFFKNRPGVEENTVVHLKNNKRVLTSNEKIDTQPIVRRISFKPNSQSVQKPKPSPNSSATVIRPKFGSLKSDQMSTPIFKRLGTLGNETKTNFEVTTSTTKKPAIERISDNQPKKFNFTPITLGNQDDKKSLNRISRKLSDDEKMVPKNLVKRLAPRRSDVFSRISL